MIYNIVLLTQSCAINKINNLGGKNSQSKHTLNGPQMKEVKAEKDVVALVTNILKSSLQ